MHLSITKMVTDYRLEVSSLAIKTDFLDVAVSIFKEVERAENYVSQEVANLRKKIFEQLSSAKGDTAMKIADIIIKKVVERL